MLILGDSFVRRLRDHLGHEELEVSSKTINFHGMSGGTVARFVQTSLDTC